MSETDDIVKSKPQAVDRHRPVTWDELGDAFETMGKVGLAMAVGMSAAGLFCRLAHQGKIKVPTLSGLMMNQDVQATPGGKRKSQR